MPETMQNRQVQSIMFHIMPSAQADKLSVPFSYCGHQILKVLAIENRWPLFDSWKTQGIEFLYAGVKKVMYLNPPIPLSQEAC